jgi:hypothetical protein
MHCKNINQFCLHFAEYYINICKDIINNQNQTETPYSNNINTITQKMKYRQNSSKEVVELYMNNLTEIINESPLFNKEEERQKALQIIWNYILKNICIKICENNINEKDKIFRTTCKKLGWLKPENLHIPKEVFSMPLFKKAEYHIKKKWTTFALQEVC